MTRQQHSRNDTLVRRGRRMASRADTTLYLYDDRTTMLGLVERVVGGWRAVRHGRDLGVFRKREQAIAAVRGDGE
jgi:hypothetical protein